MNEQPLRAARKRLLSRTAVWAAVLGIAAGITLAACRELPRHGRGVADESVPSTRDDGSDLLPARKEADAQAVAAETASATKPLLDRASETPEAESSSATLPRTETTATESPAEIASAPEPDPDDESGEIEKTESTGATEETLPDITEGVLASSSPPEAAGRKPLSPPGAEAAVRVFPVYDDEWCMWGGTPSRNMVNTFAKGIATDWDVQSGRNIKWRAELGSQAYGNPVIGEGHILVGTNNDRHRNPKISDDKGVVMCFAVEDGRFLWQMVHDKLAAGRVNDWPEQGICSSPVIQNGKAYYVSNRCQLVCVDLDGLADGNDGPYTEEKYTDPIDGDVIWLYDMIEQDGVFPHNLATSSPLIVGDLVYVVTGNGVERDHLTIPAPFSPSFMAFNKETGELVWDSAEPGEGILHGQWSSPSFGSAGGRDQVVFPGGDGWVYSFEPKSGELIWKFDCNPKDAVWKLGGLGTRNNLIATPVFHGDSVYIAVGQDPEHGVGIGHLYRIHADGKGDVTADKKAWHYGGEDFRRTISSVAVHDGLVYAADLSGFVHCLDQETGRPYWVHDLLAAVWGSPTVIDGKVYIGDEDGDVLICKTGKKFEKVNEINMDNSVYSTPIAVDGVLYISNRTTLFAIAEKK